MSDIHFRASEIDRDDDPNAGLRDDLVHDVQLMRRRIGRAANAILISGDIAFSGTKREYDFAFSWLHSKLCPAAGCEIEDVFVIPGNHDVEWSQAAKPLHRDARAKLRSCDAKDADKFLREYLSDNFSAQLMFAPIDNYNRFAARFLCSIGPYDEAHPDIKPFTTRDWDMEDGSKLRIWGFNSALISDAQDSPNQMFVDPAGAQIQREYGVAHVVMCHHPYGWLKNGAGFRERIEAVAKLHLFGHEHTRRIEEGKHFTTIRAGAVQPDRDEPGWDPGYNWIGLSIGYEGDKRYLDAEIWVRKREGARFIAVPDHDQAETWQARHRLSEWSAPIVVDKPHVGATTVMTPPDEPKTSSTSVSARIVASKMFRLAEHVQRQIIVHLSLDQDGDQGLKDYEFVLAAVNRAKSQNRLPALNEMTDEALYGQGNK
nr:metallophosphoesterase [Aurantimonas aggregata]